MSKKDPFVAEAEIAALDFLTYETPRGKKLPTQSVENIYRILTRHPKYQNHFRYDEFKNLFEFKPLTSDAFRPFEDVDVITVQSEISIDFDFFQKVGKEMVYDAMLRVFKECSYDSARDSIKALVWDNAPRLNEWLTETCGTANDVYHQAVASNWLKGLVKRICEPGCKFDYVLVLEGEQGIRKSTLLNVLGGDWYVETTMSTDNKDFFMQFQGKALIEFSEGETLNRTEVKRMKAIITTQSDKYRPPYERVSKDFPRRCVFAMTTNQEEYLKDETGNRRWLPVRVVNPAINIDWMRENREQLLAEAYHRIYTLKETVYEFPAEETRAAQAERRVSDPNTDAVVDWYMALPDSDKQEGITIDQVAKTVLHSGFAGPISRAEQMSIGNILREILSLDRKNVMVNHVRRYKYFPKDPLANLQLMTEPVNDTATF